MREFRLNNGMILPEIGFGTYKINEPEIILSAIQNGCKYFDTAAYYNNEKIIAQAIAASGQKRENFIIASKLWKSDMGYDNAKKAVNKSLENLNTDYIDIYMIHWPDADFNLNIETWRALTEFYNAKKILALGVSNFLPHHLEPIIKYALIKFSVMPSVAQIEFHPGYTQEAALRYFQEKNILVQAWSPLGRGRVLNDKLINDLANKYNATPAQICLKFAVQKNVMPLPKASSAARIRENLILNLNFNLNQEEMWRLETMPPLGWSGLHPDYERVKI